MAGADATVYVWFLGQICVNKCRTHTVASAPALIGLVFMRRFRLFFGDISRGKKDIKKIKSAFLEKEFILTLSQDSTETF